MSSDEQGENTAEDNEAGGLSLKVVPQVFGVKVVGRRRPKLNDGPFENPTRAKVRPLQNHQRHRYRELRMGSDR